MSTFTEAVAFTSKSGFFNKLHASNNNICEASTQYTDKFP